MCNIAKQYGPLLGRILLAFIFIMSGFSKIGSFSQTAGYMASKGLPMANILLTITIVIELGAGLMLVFGIKARWSAPAAEVQMQMINFMKNLAIMGGMLYIMAYGSGPYSVTRNECR